MLRPGESVSPPLAAQEKKDPGPACAGPGSVRGASCLRSCAGRYFKHLSNRSSQVQDNPCRIMVATAPRVFGSAVDVRAFQLVSKGGAQPKMVVEFVLGWRVCARRVVSVVSSHRPAWRSQGHEDTKGSASGTWRSPTRHFPQNHQQRPALFLIQPTPPNTRTPTAITQDFAE